MAVTRDVEARGMNGVQSKGNVSALKDKREEPVDFQTGVDAHCRFGPEHEDPSWRSSDDVSKEEMVPTPHHTPEGPAASISESSYPEMTKSSWNSPTGLKAMADKLPTLQTGGHMSPLPEVPHNNDTLLHSSQSALFEKKKENLGPENVLDNIKENRQLHNTQSLPVWMPSVVATTISEDAEDQTFDNIGNISLGRLRVDIDKVKDSADKHLIKTKSLASPDAAQRLPCNDDAKRREKKNTENANLRSVAESKFSDRKKKKIMKKLTRVHDNGTVEFDLGESAPIVEELFGPESREYTRDDYLESDEAEGWEVIPPLRIVMLIVGTRGDVQPFLAIGKKMQEYGHRVRLASHANFKDFVKAAGLEYYPLGGDPKVLAEYMVKNKGFLSTGPKEVRVQRKQIKSIVNSLLAPCVEPDMDTGVAFTAQVIIANPPAYGHVHVAEYLKIPLHIFFTMPWTATNAFPHPLSRLSTPAGYKLSYQVVDTMIWLGIRSIINDFRKKKLKLRPIPYLSSQGSISQLPTGYLWSPHLVPKPKDWGPLIDVVGFCFLHQASSYKPPEALVKWLKAGPAPIYVGFGSLPISDPEGMTRTIVDALRTTNQRGLINEGWGGMGKLDKPEDFVYLVQDCPHDWLFPKCVAVVHHGGAGTTAAGLKAACPTTVVPFFGDQPFWGSRIHERGVGPYPISVDKFSVDKLVDAVNFMLDPEVKRRAIELAKEMDNEDGVQGACDAFHKHIRKRIPDIMQDSPPPSPHNSMRDKFDSFRQSCWSCNTNSTAK